MRSYSVPALAACLLLAGPAGVQAQTAAVQTKVETRLELKRLLKGKVARFLSGESLKVLARPVFEESAGYFRRAAGWLRRLRLPPRDGPSQTPGGRPHSPEGYETWRSE